ncbi:uncharacterized protein LOC131319981 isoform X4 [Rhododendron vialii]|nr:uncharacterized protein LOC131319981 isoform X4 [Rhododendron vialii]
MRAESGTCNMCSAPCSSCLHANRALMGSKADEFSDESSEGNAGSQYSVNDVVPVKRTPYRSGQNSASETSNLFSVNSNQDSLSENAESKACLRTGDVEMHQNLLSGVTGGDNQLLLKPQYNAGNRTLTKKFGDQEVLESHGESISCVSSVNDAKVLASHDNRTVIGESHSCKNMMDLEAETDKVSGGLPTDAVNSPGQIEEIKVVKESHGLPGLKENSKSVDDSDESDIEEQDVKVCDICGDAGREDLLAICTRCSDGAEHTYCMRETMEKVPEGDWLCEECKFDEEIKDPKQDTTVTVDGYDKNQSSGQATPVEKPLEIDHTKIKKTLTDSDVEGNRPYKDILSGKAAGKRHADNTEVAATVKRQALETTVGLPKASSPSRIAALSRDFSFSNLDKGKVKSAHQLSSGTSSDNSKAAFSPKGPRGQTSQGTLLKSNSFHSTNAPTVKLDDEVVLQKQKSARESTSIDIKEGPVRSIGKSMSFKSVNPGRLNPSESKVKMLSPKFSHGHDVKGSKQAKERNLLERKNSFKTERSMVGSVTGNATVSTLRGDKKVAPYGESYSLTSVSNNHEPKGVQSDRKLSTLSKSNSLVTRRGSEMPVPLGETKGQSSSHGVVGASSSNGISSTCNPSSSTFTAERPFCSTNESLPDVLPRPTESTNLGERMKESSINHSRTNIVAGGRSAPCQKSKEIGSSNVENSQPLLGDASASRSLKDVDKGNKLKAAIEAAMLKKPGIYRKNKIPDQSDELSMSTTSLNCGTRPQDHQSTSINSRNNFSAEEVRERQAQPRNSAAESCEQTTANNMKHLSSLPSEAATLKIGDLNLMEPSDRKLFMRDSPSNDIPVVSVLLKMSVIPEHEYIWQGGFEVQKSGKRPELRDGIQAHLSTFASPKVPEVVNMFPPKILLHEVPRLSTWPLQFQEIGVKEDNIALYFFAKDLDSYEKSYKSLLDTMMRSDLALKGSFDGVELLIFPSNHLPEKSQRWNTLYFLWGVFRGKKAHCLQDLSASPKKYSTARYPPTTTISLPESQCPLDRDLPTCPKACNLALASRCPGPALMESPVLSAQTTKVGFDINASSLDLKDQHTQVNAGQDYRFDAASLPRIQSTNAVSFQETRLTSTPLEDNVDAESKLDIKPQLSVQAAGTISGLKKIDKIPMYLGNVTDHQQVSFSTSEIHGRDDSSENQVKYERTLKEEEGSLDTKSVQWRHQTISNWTMKENNNSQYNHGKRLHEDSTWNNVNNELLDGGFASKKQKTDCSRLSVHDRSRDINPLRGDSFGSTHDVGTSFAIKEEIGKGACVETEVSRNNIGSAGRYLFPFGPRGPVKDFNSGVKSFQDDIRIPEPNLELALGADMKPSKQGMMLPFSLGKVNLNDDHQEKAATKEEEEEDDSASLSLSLAFPFLDKVKGTGKPVSTPQQVLPDRQHVNTSLLLFEGLSEK